jgi:haloalkane dehalogenase
VIPFDPQPVDRSAFSALYPFSSHFLTIDGLRYHYLDEGRGEPLVMVHGNPTWSFFFRELVLCFRATHRVIVPDHIGCGLSQKPDSRHYDFRLASRVRDLGALLDHVAPRQPVTLVLHDWGGMIGLAWAVNHPERVRRLVVMNTAGFFPPRRKPIPLRLRLIRTPNPVMDRLVLHFNLFARAALVMAPYRKLAPEVKAGLIAPYNCPRSRLATLKFVQDIPLRPSDPSGGIVARVDRELQKFARRPVQVIWGAHDFVFDRAYFEEWQRRLPDARTAWLADAGHYLLEDQPRRIVRLIRDFLDGT